MERELQTYRIIKNNLVFLVVFTVLLLGYIIYLCYEIYQDSKIKKIPFISACPDYWTLSNTTGQVGYCIDNHKIYKDLKADPGMDTNCDKWPLQGNKCFKTDNNLWYPNNLSKAFKKKCKWAKDNNVSWDSLESGNVC